MRACVPYLQARVLQLLNCSIDPDWTPARGRDNCVPGSWFARYTFVGSSLADLPESPTNQPARSESSPLLTLERTLNIEILSLVLAPQDGLAYPRSRSKTYHSLGKISPANSTQRQQRYALFLLPFRCEIIRRGAWQQWGVRYALSRWLCQTSVSIWPLRRAQCVERRGRDSLFGPWIWGTPR